LNIIFNLNGRSYFKRKKSKTSIKTALTGLLAEELLNNGMIYAVKNGKIIKLENEITNEGAITILGKLLGGSESSSDSDDEYDEFNETECEEELDMTIGAISSAKKVEERLKGNVHYHFYIQNEKVEKHWKIRGPHNMICQELFWNVRVINYTVREKRRGDILYFGPKTFRQEEEVDIYSLPNYEAGPFFSELILNYPRAQKERWKKTTEAKIRKAENKRKKKEPIRFPLTVRFKLMKPLEGKKPFRTDERCDKFMYCSENNSVQFRPGQIKASGKKERIMINEIEVAMKDNLITVDKDQLRIHGVTIEYQIVCFHQD
jgi:hypothetical protein